MKKILMILACAAVCGMSNAQVTIKLSDLKSDTAMVALVDKSMRSIEKTDTIVSKKGVFTYNVSGEKTRVAMFTVKTDNGPARMQLYLVPGEKGTLTGSTEHAVWSGKGFYGELAKLEATTDPITDEMSTLVKDYQDKVKAGGNAQQLQQEVMPKYQELAKKAESAIKDYIKANPKSGVSATCLSQVEDQEEVLGLLDASLKTGKFSDLLDAAQANIDAAKAQKEAAKAVADGCVAPDFTLKDINGKDLSLSSLRGKYVVLDFWGSWCGWCIKGFPEMKEYYKKYEGKFEILGVDCNDTEEKWKAACQKNELPWKLVFNPRTSDLCTKYAIQGFPTKIVIDPEGKIAKTVVGEDPAFYQYLDSLFGGK